MMEGGSVFDMAVVGGWEESGAPGSSFGDHTKMRWGKPRKKECTSVARNGTVPVRDSGLRSSITVVRSTCVSFSVRDSEALAEAKQNEMRHFPTRRVRGTS